MAETIVHTGEAAAEGAVAGLAGAVGAVTNEAAHHAETLAAHAEKFTEIEGKTEWLENRLDSLERTASEVPAQALTDLREKVTTLESELAMRTAALSEAIVKTTPEEPQTEPPPAQVNEAQEQEVRGPLGGLRKALHRLL